MLAIATTPKQEFIARRDAIRASWTHAERKRRVLVAHVKQSDLIILLPKLREKRRTTPSSPQCVRA